MARRDRLRPDQLARDAESLREVLLNVPEVGRAAVVAVYLSVQNEPGTGPLLEALSKRGVRVLLPLLREDFDLDWGAYTVGDELRPSRMGLLEPVGERLGPETIASADAVLLPGLAVDRSGYRLGRGAGCYDRVLPRLAREAFSCALLHDGEVLDHPLPRHEHDQPVQAVATPSGLLRFT